MIAGRRRNGRDKAWYPPGVLGRHTGLVGGDVGLTEVDSVAGDRIRDDSALPVGGVSPGPGAAVGLNPHVGGLCLEVYASQQGSRERGSKGFRDQRVLFHVSLLCILADPGDP